MLACVCVWGGIIAGTERVCVCLHVCVCTYMTCGTPGRRLAAMDCLKGELVATAQC